MKPDVMVLLILLAIFLQAFALDMPSVIWSLFGGIW